MEIRNLIILSLLFFSAVGHSDLRRPVEFWAPMLNFTDGHGLVCAYQYYPGSGNWKAAKEWPIPGTKDIVVKPDPINKLQAFILTRDTGVLYLVNLRDQNPIIPGVRLGANLNIQDIHVEEGGPGYIIYVSIFNSAQMAVYSLSRSGKLEMLREIRISNNEDEGPGVEAAHLPEMTSIFPVAKGQVGVISIHMNQLRGFLPSGPSDVTIIDTTRQSIVRRETLRLWNPLSSHLVGGKRMIFSTGKGSKHVNDIAAGMDPNPEILDGGVQIWNAEMTRAEAVYAIEKPLGREFISAAPLDLDRVVLITLQADYSNRTSPVFTTQPVVYELSTGAVTPLMPSSQSAAEPSHWSVAVADGYIYVASRAGRPGAKSFVTVLDAKTLTQRADAIETPLPPHWLVTR